MKNEKEEEHKQPNSNSKRKIIRTEIKRKQINISKPPKNSKKYSYYTDLLDKDGHLMEQKLKQMNLQNKQTKSNERKKINRSGNLTFKKVEDEEENNNNCVNFENNINNNINNINVVFSNKNETKEKNENKENKNETKENKNETKENNKKFAEIETLSGYSPDKPSLNSINNNNENNFSSVKKKLENFDSKSKEEIINELNEEIKKFKEERKLIEKMKNDYEHLQLKLESDISEFNLKKMDFEIFVEKEKKKIVENKKYFNNEKNNLVNLKNQNLSLQNQIKKDKEIIESLKNQINKLNQEIKQKDINYKLNIEKMKKIINEGRKLSL